GRLEPPPGFNPNQAQASDWPAIAALANYATGGQHNLPPAVVLPEKMIRTENLRARPGQFEGLLGSRWDPWVLEAAAWWHRGCGACPRCYDGRLGRQDGRVYGEHHEPLFRAPNLVLPEDVSPARLRDRVTLLATFDEQRRQLERSAATGRYDRHPHS